MRFRILANISPTSFLSLTNVADQSVNTQSANTVNNETFTSAKENVDQFSSSIKNTNNSINDINSLIANTKDDNKKQELIARKQNLVAKKAEIEGKQASLKGKMSQLKSEMEAHRSASAQIKNELNKLNANKSSLEKTMQNDSKELTHKNAALKTVSSSIDETKAELDATIEELNKAVSDMTKKSEDELKQQRNAISAATTEALELVQNGEITSEDMPSYIASRINGFDSVGSTTMGAAAVTSTNTKIKALCSQLSNYVDQQGSIQLSVKASSNKLQSVSPLFEALNTQIKAKGSELSTSEGLMNAKQTEFGSTSTEYTRNDSQISDIGSQLADIDTQIAAIETPAVTEEKPQNAVNAGNVQYNQFFVSNNSANAKSDINFDDEMTKINSKYDQTLKEEVKNTEAESLKSKMSEADKLITTLRNQLTDNAQKIIEERLEATKRK